MFRHQTRAIRYRMRDSPHRLRRLATGPMLPRRDGATIHADLDLWPFSAGAHHHHIMRRFRAIRRALIALLWTLPAMLIQAVLLLLPGRGKVAFARICEVTAVSELITDVAADPEAVRALTEAGVRVTLV